MPANILWIFRNIAPFSYNLQCEMFKFFCYTTIVILPQNQEEFLNIWLKQTFKKAVMYLQTSEQQLFGRNLGCYLHYFQYQLSCYGCIFKFPNTNTTGNAPCATSIWCTICQHSLWHLKSHVTDSILKLHWKKFR